MNSSVSTILSPSANTRRYPVKGILHCHASHTDHGIVDSNEKRERKFHFASARRIPVVGRGRGLVICFARVPGIGTGLSLRVGERWTYLKTETVSQRQNGTFI